MPKLKDKIKSIYDTGDNGWTVGSNCSRIERILNKQTGNVFFRLYGFYKNKEIVISDVSTSHITQVMYDREAQVNA